MFTINATKRKELGKSASRRLRTANKFPAILYGNKGETISIKLDYNTVINMQAHPRFYKEVFVLNIEGEKINVKIQAVQHHPFKPKLQHIDFIRV